MSQPYTPSNAPIRDPEMREIHERDYDPARLLSDGAALVRLAAAVVQFAVEKCDLDKDQEDGGFRYRSFVQSFVEQIGPSSDTIVYTDVEVTLGNALDPAASEHGSEATANGYYLSVSQVDVDGYYLTDDDYAIDIDRGGRASLAIRKGIEGVAEALKYDDPAFLRARAWHGATPYEAADMAAELERIQKLKLEASGEVV